MIAFPSASDALVQPHHAGVRLGKCHASRTVYSALAPGAISRARQIEPTQLRSAASGPSSPSLEKSSQNSNGLAHHLARGQPRRRVTLPLSGWTNASANEPAMGESAAAP